MRRNRMLAFHPKRNRLLKATWGVLLILALVPLGTPPAYGWSEPAKNGDPFSNGTFWPSEGTFQAIMRGKNLTGVATFSTVGTGIEDITSSGGGIFSVFFDGITYVGNVNSAIDVHSGQIAATFEGSIPGQEGEGSTIVNSEFGVISETFEQGGTSTVSTPGGMSTTTTVVLVEDPPGNPISRTTETITEITPDVTTTTTNPDTLTQEFGFTDTIANFEFVDALYSAGSFVARIRDSWPNQSFDGKGTFSFSQIVLSAEGIPVVATETVKIKVDGVRVSDAVQSFTPFDIQVPGVVVSFEIVRGGTSGGGTSN